MVEAHAWVVAFSKLQSGWVEGRNIRIDYHWAAASDLELVQRFAKTLVVLQPDLILSNNTPTTAAYAHHLHHFRERRRSQKSLI